MILLAFPSCFLVFVCLFVCFLFVFFFQRKKTTKKGIRALVEIRWGRNCQIRLMLYVYVLSGWYVFSLFNLFHLQYVTTVSVKVVGTLWGLLVPSMLVYKIW